VTSKERVLRAFEHAEGDRVPAWCGASPEFWAKAKKQLNLDDEGLRRRLGDDFRQVTAVYNPPDASTPTQNGPVTPFGIERAGRGYGQPINHPLAAAGLDEVHSYPWPDPACVDVSHIPEQARTHAQQYAILGGDWSPFWHDAIDLLSMESLLVAMYEQPQIVDAVLGHIVEYYFEVSRSIFDAAATEIDIFFIGNDFGSQHGPQIGQRLFRRFVSPHLTRLADLGHAYGLKVMLHCCGGIAELIPLFVEAGFDGLHAVQPSCRGMDLARLKADFGDRILFNGAIDSQHVLIEGTVESVRTATREVLEIMSPGGGYVAGASHDYILEETPVENVVAMFDAISEFGAYH